MSVAQQWSAIGSNLSGGWQRASLRLELRDRESADAAAAMLAPAGPYRAEPTVLQFSVARDGSSIGPDNLVRLLRRVPVGTLTLSGSQAAPQTTATRPVTALTDAWDTALASLPPDWSDLFAEFQLISTDFIERAAVLCVQMNPRRDGERAVMRFRCARQQGYGVAPEMARRCFERCDAESIRGSVTVLRVLSDSRHVGTQGPVWLSAGQTL